MAACVSAEGRTGKGGLGQRTDTGTAHAAQVQHTPRDPNRNLEPAAPISLYRCLLLASTRGRPSEHLQALLLHQRCVHLCILPDLCNRLLVGMLQLGQGLLPAHVHFAK